MLGLLCSLTNRRRNFSTLVNTVGSRRSMKSYEPALADAYRVVAHCKQSMSV